MAPATMTSRFIRPFKSLVVEWKPAITLYCFFFNCKKVWLPSSNFWLSSSSLAKDCTTRMPSRLSSAWALISPN